MTYPADNVPDLLCARCLQPADVDWHDASRLDTGRVDVVPGRMWCRTDGCVDERGSRQTYTPPTPDELTAKGRQALHTIRTQLAPWPAHP